MKKLLAIFLLAACSVFGQQLYSVKVTQLYDYSIGQPRYIDRFINPVASSSGLLGFGADTVPIYWTLGTGLSVSNGALNVSGAPLSSIGAYSIMANNTSASAAPVGAQVIMLGTPAITDTGIFTQFTGSANSYLQSVWQNTNGGATASTDIVLNNDLGTATTHYVNLGINSSGFTGSGSLNLANAGYLFTATGDLALGTSTANAVHILANGAATDAITVSSGNAVSLPGLTSNGIVTTSGGNGALSVTATTGSGNVVLVTSPTLVTPTLGAALATSINGNIFTTGTYTLTGASGKTLTFNNSLTLTGTDATVMTFPTTTATIARTDAAQTFTGNQTFPGILNTTGTSANSGNGMVQRFRNGYATAAQAPSATTRTYITGSDLGPFTAGQLQVGTIFHWHIDLTKTNAGIASSTFDICFGTAGTTGDTARVSFTKPAGVANADDCSVDIYATIKTNSASGVVIADMVLLDNQTGAGGFLASGKYVFKATVTSGTFDTTAPTHVGLCITTGASDVYTINHVQAWSQNL